MPSIPGASVLGDIGSITNRFLLGYAIGTAAGPALEPYSQDLANAAWKTNMVKPPTIYTVVTGVARGQIPYSDGQTWAHEQGFDDHVYDSLIAGAQTAMSVGELINAYRRKLIDQTQLYDGLRKHEIEQKWWGDIEQLANEPLEPAEIAKAVHRGIMRGAGLLVVTPPTTAGNVPQVPPSPLDPATEAEWSGIDHERLRVLVGNAGLPPGIIQMLELMNRGVITMNDFLRGVGESNMRNEWGQAVANLARRLLTPHEYEELALRGWITRSQADAGAALSGMTAADSQLLFNMLGRPLNVHAVTTGLARGGKYGGNYQGVPSPYLEALQESNVRPEWGNLAYANRYSYPSAFVLRGLAEAGQLGNAAAVQQILLEIGWPPHLAASVSVQWVPAGAAMDKHVAKAQTQLWTTTHRSYVASEIDDPTADAALASAGVAAAAIPQVLALWAQERSLIRAQLSPAQVKKAVSEAVPNPATGAPWNLADGMAALLARGYSQNDAATLLAE